MKRYDTKQVNNGVVSGDTISFSPVKGDTISFQPIRDKSTPKSTDGTIKIAPIKPLKIDTAVKKPTQTKQRLIRFSACPPQPTPQVMLETCRSGRVFQHVRLWVLLPLLLFAIFHLIYSYFSYSFFPLLNKYNGYVSVFVLLLTMLLTLDVSVNGLMELIHFRFNSCAAITLACLIALVQGLLVLRRNSVSYCEAMAILLFVQYRALVMERSALCSTLQTVCSFDSPMGIFDAQRLLQKTSSLRRERADMDFFIHRLTQKSEPQKIIDFVTVVLIPVTLAVSCFLSVQMNLPLLQVWTVLLLWTFPCAALFSYARPFRVLAKRLSRFNGALCGWQSAVVFGAKHTIILRDEDLFPSDDLLSNGMKLFQPFEAERVISYGYSALSLVDSPLKNLFCNLLPNQNLRTYPVTEHRFYDGGGIGIEIAGDIVLVGHLSFMRDMGIEIPTGTRLRQAVYVSINGELAGIFAINYKPNDSTRVGLRDVFANRNFSVVLATRDFLITPELIAAKYDLSADTLIFPNYNERLRLSEVDGNVASTQGGLIAKDTFGAFATTVAAGKTLRMTARTAMYMGIFSGIFGLALCVILTVLGSLSTVSPLHIVVFHLLWTAITTSVSYILLKL